MNRRGWVLLGVIAVVLVIIIAVLCAVLIGKDDDKKTIRERVTAALEDVPLIDGSVLVYFGRKAIFLFKLDNFIYYR